MTDDLVPVTRWERVEPELEGVALLLASTRGLDPERAWEIAVSGETAARMAGTAGEEPYTATAQVLAQAAAYGWWPKRSHDGDYSAVPLRQWVADGHPFTPKVPSAEMMLDRWGIQPVVIDAMMDDVSPPAV